MASAVWCEMKAPATVVMPPKANWLVPNRAEIVPDREGSTASPPAMALVDTNPSDEITSTRGPSTPTGPPKPVIASISSTLAATRAPIAPKAIRRSAGTARSRRRLIWEAIMKPAAFSPNTQPK